MSRDIVEVLLRKELVEDECVVLIKGEADNSDVIEVLLLDRKRTSTFSEPSCPYCGSKPMLLRIIGRQYCFTCKKYI
ncbi:hypothetical protein [Thermofilum sp.]|uniref:hypothetical protein n=1 Tax=Thermofilum sp. TaxID=1961369 RepID=UPI0031641B1D